jgi:hypothetical protein
MEVESLAHVRPRPLSWERVLDEPSEESLSSDDARRLFNIQSPGLFDAAAVCWTRVNVFVELLPCVRSGWESIPRAERTGEQAGDVAYLRKCQC